MTLQSSDVALGTWNPTALTFTALTGSGTSNANAVQVTVNLTSARGNPVNMFFASVIGIRSENITASAVAGTKRCDVVISQDISCSYSADLSYAVTGHQAMLTDFNRNRPRRRWASFSTRVGGAPGPPCSPSVRTLSL